MSEFSIRVGNGGWLCLSDGRLPGRTYLRLREDARRRLRVHELYADCSDAASLRTADLREVPLAHIETWANAEGEQLGAMLRRRLNLAAPDLSTLASYFSTTFGNLSKPEAVRADWVRMSFLSAFPDEVLVDGGFADVAKRRPARVGLPAGSSLQPAAPDASAHLVAGPAGNRLTDDFLRDVGAAYAAAMVRRERPNVALAADCGYPVRTVQRWVAEARTRGIMPPARKGSAG